MPEPTRHPIQDLYPDDVAHCYGCGHLNERGHRIKSDIEGDETVTRFTPQPHHTAIPGYVYGGLIASLIDCHGTGTAAASGAARAVAADPDGAPLLDESVLDGSVAMPRYVTGKLEVSYRRPTPLGPELELRGRVRERRGRKVVVDITLSAEGVVTAEGTVVAVEMPESLG
ncbi:PaaI family thioesterase [bacterium]|nr:PaaI family thioesterase [bacterium]